MLGLSAVFHSMSLYNITYCLGRTGLQRADVLLWFAAMHVPNDTSDPFFTRLHAGAYAAQKPGQPCDDATLALQREQKSSQ
jgi:hypothetical protein